MFRDIRRGRQALPEAESLAILERGSHGVLAAVTACPRASFCVIDRSDVVPEDYSTNFRSVIAFGEVREVTDEAAKRRAIERLALKYAPDDSEANRAAAIDREWGALCVLELRIEHLSGKESTALAKERAKA